METNSKVYAHAKNLYVRAIFSHRGNFCAIIEAEKKKEVKLAFYLQKEVGICQFRKKKKSFSKNRKEKLYMNKNKSFPQKKVCEKITGQLIRSCYAVRCMRCSGICTGDGNL